MNAGVLAWRTPGRRGGGGQGDAQSVGQWVFMAVATALFSLFGVAYVMRLSASDAVAIALPWQLWLSTAWLLAGSVMLRRAAWRAQAGLAALTPLLAGGVCTLAFVATQAWAWQALLGARVSLTGNPAGSFFYLLTALHAVHVAGGLLAWAWLLHGPARAPWRVALCARYWHFLLVVWLALFATLGVVDPALAGRICGVR